MNQEDFKGVRPGTFAKISQSTAWLGLGALMLASPWAHAVPFSTDLAISGSIGYDTGYAASQLSGDGSQSGSIKLTQAGSTANSTFTDASVSGTNPLSGSLTDFGDGIGFTGRASASGANQNSTFGLGIDIGLNIANNSATDTYKIIFNLIFDHRVDSNGADAYADSNFYVFDRAGNQTLFFTDLLTDTVNGNQNGGAATGGTGGPMTEQGPSSFAITLAAGQSLVFDPSLYDLSWTLTGGAYKTDSSSSAFLDAFLSIASVENLTNPNPNPNPNPTPEPATLALLGLGLAGLGLARRRA